MATALLQRTSIGARLSLVLGVLLGLTALIAYNSLNSVQQAVNELINGDGEIASLAQQAQITMLQTRRAEKDYLLRFKQLGPAQAREIYAQLVSLHVNELMGILHELHGHGVVISNLLQALQHYQSRFLDVVALYEKHGHVDSGLEGQFRTAAHAIEHDLRTDHPQWLVMLLQMRRHEKDYLLRGDARYISLLHQRGEELKASLATASGEAHYINLMDTYLARFDQLVIVDKEIAAGVAAFRNTVQQLEPEFDKLITQGASSAMRVKQGMKHTATVGKRWVLLAGALAILLGFAAAIWLSRSITRPVMAVSEAVNRFAGGDLKQRVTIRGNDEVGDLAQSFNDMAEELQRSIHDMEQFAYVASHDLQEPLRMVASYTELLALRYHGQLDERADKYIHYASDGARRMQVLIDALLAYSRVGTKEGKLAPVDMAGVAAEAIENLKASILESGANIRLGNLPVVMADHVQLVQLLQNLIGNAIKYRSGRSPDIHITATRSGAMAQLSVADNGIGIAPEYHERIFQIFQRLHDRDKYEGAGLGLALVKRIVERHGGKIWLESKEGRGTVFHFTLLTAKDD
jgi:signal transduction histidine kinase